MTISTMTLREQWTMLSDKETCPARLSPFMGSRVLAERAVRGGGGMALLIELAPSLTHSSLAHLGNTLASFFDLSVGSVFIEAVQEKARRIEVTFTTVTS